MIYLILVAVGTFSVALLYRLVRGQAKRISSLAELQSSTVLVDLAAFRNLTSAGEQAYLQAQLSPRDFRRIQRLRALAALDYVDRAKHNAAVLIRVGEMAQAGADPEIARAAQELVNSAIRLRLYAFIVECRLYLEAIRPGSTASAARFVNSYEDLIGRVTNLGRLQQPAYVRRIASAL